MATLFVTSRHDTLDLIGDGGRLVAGSQYEGSIEVRVGELIMDKERLAVLITCLAPNILSDDNSKLSDKGRVELTLIHPTLCISYSCVLRFAKQPTPAELEPFNCGLCMPFSWQVKDSTPASQTPISFRRSSEGKLIQDHGDKGWVSYHRGQLKLNCPAFNTIVTITNPATFGAAIDAFVEETQIWLKSNAERSWLDCRLFIQKVLMFCLVGIAVLVIAPYILTSALHAPQ
jgi:hypothetical protein